MPLISDSNTLSSNQVKDRIMLVKYNMPRDPNLVMSVFVLNSSFNNNPANENRLYFYVDLYQRVYADALISYIGNLTVPVSSLYIGVESAADSNAAVVINLIRNTWMFSGGRYGILPSFGSIQIHNRVLLDFLNSEVFYFNQGQLSGAFNTVSSCITAGQTACDQLVCRMISTLYVIARSKYTRLS